MTETQLFYIFVKICHPPGEGSGTPLQYSWLENPMDRGAWKAAVHGVAEGWTRLSDFTLTFHFHALEKEMATHSSVLAWRIPGIRGAWWTTVSGVTQGRTQLKQLSSSSSSKANTSIFLSLSLSLLPCPSVGEVFNMTPDT